MWEEVKRILQTSSVAVVGLSPDRISPVTRWQPICKGGLRRNPRTNCQSVLGKRCYGSLADVPGPVDIVTIFRVLSTCPDRGTSSGQRVRMVWIQDRIINQEAAPAPGGGLVTVMDRCIMRIMLVCIGRKTDYDRRSVKTQENKRQGGDRLGTQGFKTKPI